MAGLVSSGGVVQAGGLRGRPVVEWLCGAGWWLISSAWGGGMVVWRWLWDRGAAAASKSARRGFDRDITVVVFTVPTRRLGEIDVGDRTVRLGQRQR
jgi:hypothetical protein